jgi:hypothetical protein
MDPVWIPFVAIVLGLGMGFWRIYWDFQRKRLVYEERRAMIEKGMEPPPLPPEEQRRRVGTPDQSLRRGLIMLFLGAGLGAAFVTLRSTDAFHDPDVQGLLAIGALVVLFLGLGHLAYYAVAKKQAGPAPVDAGH